MRLIVDNALSPVLASALTSGGHDAVHVRTVGMTHAKDVDIFAFAAEQDRVVLSADTDFGTILALRSVRSPSVVLWRRQSPRRPLEQAAIFMDVLRTTEPELLEGAIVVIEVARLRVRRLPIGNE